MNIVVGITLGLILARLAAGLWLSRLNRRHVLAHANEIPPAFRGIIDEPTYKKSVEYTLAKSKFAEAEDGYNVAVLIIFLFSGVLPWAFILCPTVWATRPGRWRRFCLRSVWRMSLPGLPLRVACAIPSGGKIRVQHDDAEDSGGWIG